MPIERITLFEETMMEVIGEDELDIPTDRNYATHHQKSRNDLRVEQRQRAKALLDEMFGER